MKPRRTLLHLPVVHHTRRFLRTFRENLQLGTILAFVAGIVNTVGFLQFGTYVSHISGHATRTAVEYTEGNTSAALVFFLETMSFIAGAGVTSFFMHGQHASDSRIKYTLPIALEASCLLVFLVINRFHGWFWLKIDHISLITLILAHAMGMQNALLRQASGAIVRTTHMTGVATDIGVDMGAAIRAAQLRWKKDRSLGQSHGLDVLQEIWLKLWVGRFAFHCLLLFFFFLGAVVGTIGYLYFMGATLMIPFMILCGLAVREFMRKIPGE